MSDKQRGNGEQNLALFIDFENIALGVHEEKRKFDINLVLARLLEKGNVVVKRAYSDWSRFREYKQQLHAAAVELIEVPQRRLGGKNSADIRMVVDVMDLSFNKPHIDAFVIASGDVDFSALVSKLRENDKYVIGLGVKKATSDMLVANCDEFIFYEDLVREQEKQADTKQKLPTRLAKLPQKKIEAFELFLAAIRGLVRENKDVIWGSMIKQTMKRLNPSFDESYHGYSSFSKMLEDAEKHRLVKLRKDEKSGGYIVEAVADDLV
ncbi:MAG: hypothetical protein KatS3mg102_2489 [Planctomycetota bacterium]|nr:MAG: hypothetical protein KatS3mg102_2489 [Planctomycetota bacterium]